MGGPEGLRTRVDYFPQQFLNKQRRERETKLRDEIKELDQQYLVFPSPDLRKRKLFLQAEQNWVYTRKSTHLLT